MPGLEQHLLAGLAFCPFREGASEYYEYLKGVFAPDLAGDKNGPSGSHFRDESCRTGGWSRPNMIMVRSELAGRTPFEAGAVEHLRMDDEFFQYVGLVYPRLGEDRGTVVFGGKEMEFNDFKNGPLHCSYSRAFYVWRLRHRMPDVKKIIDAMPTYPLDIGRFHLRSDWKEQALAWIPDGGDGLFDNELPVAFAPELLNGFLAGYIERHLPKGD